MSTHRLFRDFGIERLGLVVLLIAIAVASWVYVLGGADMSLMMAMSGAPIEMPVDRLPWLHILAVVFAWAAMMFAMMLPGAIPMLLFVHRILQSRATGRAWWHLSMFALGYFVIWTGFSGVAALAQLALDRFRLLSPGMAIASPLVVGGLILLAGLYQFTSGKRGCLRHCASPLDFVIGHWRPGTDGALIMGLQHGAYCLGCCWALMALLFAGGMMNLAWIGGLSLYVLVEKSMPIQSPARSICGLLLVLWGGFAIWRAIGFA